MMILYNDDTMDVNKKQKLQKPWQKTVKNTIKPEFDWLNDCRQARLYTDPEQSVARLRLLSLYNKNYRTDHMFEIFYNTTEYCWEISSYSQKTDKNKPGDPSASPRKLGQKNDHIDAENAQSAVDITEKRALNKMRLSYKIKTSSPYVVAKPRKKRGHRARYLINKSFSRQTKNNNLWFKPDTTISEQRNYLVIEKNKTATLAERHEGCLTQAVKPDNITASVRSLAEL